MLKVKNWEEFQHFKDRSPPWIKLYKTILERRDIAMISDRYFRVLIGLWLLASEDPEKEGNLPPISDIAFRLRKTEEEIIDCLHGLEDFVIGVIPPRYHDDINTISLTRSQETETEAYSTGRGREDILPPPKSKKRQPPKSDDAYSPEFEIFWKGYGPNGSSKNDAWKSYQRAIKTGATHADITGKLEPYANYLAVAGITRAYACTWLNGKRWEVDYAGLCGTAHGVRPPGHGAAQDPASRAASEAERIIAKRREAREAAAMGRDTNYTESTGAGSTDAPAVSGIRGTGDLWRQGADDGMA